jgi:drug/metabolite transporter (DMT)-like permease
MSSPVAHRLQILGAAFLFSTGGAAIKATTLTSWQVASFRSGLAALALMLALRTWRGWWRPRVLAVGACYAATMILYVTANKLTTAANTIFLQSTAPIYLLLLGPWLLRERIGRGDLLFSATLAAGMVMFFVGFESPVATAPHPARGNVLAALSGLSWALTIMGLRLLGRGEAAEGTPSAGPAVIAGNLIASLVCLPAALPVLTSRPADWAVVGYLGVFQIGLAYFWMTRAVRQVPAFEISLLLLLEPVLNVFWAWLVHGEWPGPWSLGGCLAVLGATTGHTLTLIGQRARPA